MAEHNSYLTPDSLDAIRDAVRIQSKATGIKQQTIYAAIRRRYNARTYYHVPADKFADLIAFVQSFGIEPKAAPANVTDENDTAPAVFETISSEYLFTFEGTKDLRTMRAQVVALQRRLQKILNDGLNLLGDIEQVTGVSPFAR